MREMMVMIDKGRHTPLGRRDAHDYCHRVKCSRWHNIATEVGWLGVFCGDFIPAAIFHSGLTSQRAFARFIRFYRGKHNVMEQKLMEHWPQAPACLRYVGSLFFYVAVSLMVQTYLMPRSRLCLRPTLTL